MIDVRDVVHHVVSAVILPGRMATDGKAAILHLSVAGHAAKHRALWAAILNRRREPIRMHVGGEWHYAVRVDGRNQYVTSWNDQPLPESGMAHMALTHHSAFEPVLGQDFLHLSGNDLTGAPDLGLFAQQLDRAISMPFDRTMAARLWEVGRHTRTGHATLITPLPRLGCQGCRVSADEERWMRAIIAIQRGIDPEAMDKADCSVQEIGAVTPIADIVEVAGEGDDESEDEA